MKNAIKWIGLVMVWTGMLTGLALAWANSAEAGAVATMFAGMAVLMVWACMDGKL